MNVFPKGLEEEQLEQRKSLAKELYMRDVSLRVIAERVLPGKANGHVTIHRWAVREGWKAERDERRQQEAVAEHDRYLEALSEIKDRHLRIAHKAQMAVEYALDAYFLTNEKGEVVGIRRNQYGNPAIGGQALVQLLSAATQLEYQSYGMKDGLPQADAQTLVVTEAPRTVDADPALVKRLGDLLAVEAATSSSSSPPASETLVTENGDN